MYQYSEFDRSFVNQRVAHYRDQTQRYLDGKLSDDEFLQLRLRNGLYIQRLAPMLRVAVPYGTLSSKQLRALAAISRDYDRGYGHLSTRQNMQFNWPALEDVPDILQGAGRCGYARHSDQWELHSQRDHRSICRCSSGRNH
jgi:sulfite reductase (NADPH) hemoprotein beta-component